MTWLEVARAVLNLSAIVGIAAGTLLACEWLLGPGKKK